MSPHPFVKRWRAASLAKLASAALIVSLLGSPSAQSATVTNRDGREHRLSIKADAGARELVLKPGESAKDLCGEGCIVRLNGSADDDYELAGSDVVSIEDGFLYYDGPAGSEAGASRGREQAPAGGRPGR